MKKSLAGLLVIAILASMFTFSAFAAGTGNVEMETVYSDALDYADAAAAQTGLSANWDITAGGGQTFGDTNFGFADGRIFLKGFNGLRYKNALEGAYEFSYDFQFAGTSYGTAARSALFIRTSTKDNIMYLWEKAGNHDEKIGKSGILLYMWNSYATIKVKTYTDGTWDWATLAENVSLGANVANGTVTIKVVDDGVGNIKLYAGETNFATIKLSDSQDFTVGDVSYKAYRNAVVTASNGGTVKSAVANAVVADDNATVAFAHRAGTVYTAYYDNLTLKTPKVAEEDPVEMETIVDEKFDYADSAAAQTPLSANWEIFAARGNWASDKFGVSNNQLFMKDIQSFRYKNEITGAYELSYSILQEGGHAGRETGISLIVRNSLLDSAATLSEDYPSDSHPCGQSGLMLYMWSTYAQIYVRTRTEAGDWDYKSLANNIPTGANVNKSDTNTTPVTVKIVDDGNGTIDFYANGNKFATVKLGDVKDVTVGNNTYSAYTSAEATYATAGAAMGSKYTNAIVAKESATFAYSKRAWAYGDTAWIDNIVLKTPKKPVDNEQTGDLSVMGIAVVAIVSCAGVIVVSKKRRIGA